MIFTCDSEIIATKTTDSTISTDSFSLRVSARIKPQIPITYTMYQKLWVRWECGNHVRGSASGLSSKYRQKRAENPARS